MLLRNIQTATNCNGTHLSNIINSLFLPGLKKWTQHNTFFDAELTGIIQSAAIASIAQVAANEQHYTYSILFMQAFY